jgi:hypothetical protein
MLIRSSPATYEEMARVSGYIRYQAIGELEEPARAGLDEFAQ